MGKKIHFFIIDDDQVLLGLYTRLLEKAGHQVTTSISSVEAIDKIAEANPDCILCDLVLPIIDGLELFQRIRQTKLVRQPPFIIITGKQFEYDKRQALDIGVDGYFLKPINQKTFVHDLIDVIYEKMVVTFWGCHGTLPVPGPDTIRYGGNTNCVTVKLRNNLFIFDAGTGIKVLSNALIAEDHFPMTAKIFISHPHYDHINGLPFFAPLYMKGNKFEIFGANQRDMSFEQVIADQMDSVYFPVTMKEFTSQVIFHPLTAAEKIQFGEVTIKTMFLNHPGSCLGFKLEYKGKIFCYITDNELYLEDAPAYNPYEVERLIDFIQNADLAIIDSTYSDEMYLKKVGWGHSSVSRVVDIADKAHVKLLCLFHHDPDDTDVFIDQKLKQAHTLLKAKGSETKCIAPKEGEKIIIDLFPF